MEPHSLCEVPLLIEAQMLEEQDIVAYFSVFGSPDPPLVNLQQVPSSGIEIHCITGYLSSLEKLQCVLDKGKI